MLSKWEPLGQELLDKVAEKNPQKALELLLKLSEFALPKLRAIEVNNESLKDSNN